MSDDASLKSGNDSQLEVVEEKEDGSSDTIPDSEASSDSEVHGEPLRGIRAQLRHYLHELSWSMDFASSGLCPNPENPGIWISGLGGVGLPLSERDAVLISKIAHAAPFGMGSDTIVDTTFRKTQELNASDFELKNPKWDITLAAVVQLARRRLAVPEGCEVKAVLHKMLLYSEGSMFKQHRELVTHRIRSNGRVLANMFFHLSSQKDNNMFGTLVICLPSKHEGGEVTVVHGGREKILRTARTSAYDYSYLCWYVKISSAWMSLNNINIGSGTLNTRLPQ